MLVLGEFIADGRTSKLLKRNLEVCLQKHGGFRMQFGKEVAGELSVLRRLVRKQHENVNDAFTGLDHTYQGQLRDHIERRVADFGVLVF